MPETEIDDTTPAIVWKQQIEVTEKAIDKIDSTLSTKLQRYNKAKANSAAVAVKLKGFGGKWDADDPAFQSELQAATEELEAAKADYENDKSRKDELERNLQALNIKYASTASTSVNKEADRQLKTTKDLLDIQIKKGTLSLAEASEAWDRAKQTSDLWKDVLTSAYSQAGPLIDRMISSEDLERVRKGEDRQPKLIKLDDYLNFVTGKAKEYLPPQLSQDQWKAVMGGLLAGSPAAFSSSETSQGTPAAPSSPPTDKKKYDDGGGRSILPYSTDIGTMPYTPSDKPSSLPGGESPMGGPADDDDDYPTRGRGPGPSSTPSPIVKPPADKPTSPSSPGGGGSWGPLSGKPPPGGLPTGRVGGYGDSPVPDLLNYGNTPPSPPTKPGKLDLMGEDVGNFFGDLGSGIGDSLGGMGSGIGDLLGGIGPSLGRGGDNIEESARRFEEERRRIEEEKRRRNGYGR